MVLFTVWTVHDAIQTLANLGLRLEVNTIWLPLPGGALPVRLGKQNDRNAKHPNQDTQKEKLTFHCKPSNKNETD